MNESLPSPYTYAASSTAMLVGTGLMGRDAAQQMARCMPIKRLVLVDRFATLNVGGVDMPLADFAANLPRRPETEVVHYVADITKPDEVAAIFQKERDIAYLVVTSGISPKCGPPEDVPLSLYQEVYNVNALGPLNLITTAVTMGALAKRSKAVLILSTAATTGAEGRAGSPYEMSKAALRNFMKCQGAYFARKHGLIINAISPSPLEGPMASGNPLSASRFAAVLKATPVAATRAPNITAQILAFLATESNALAQDLVICGGYTGIQAHYGYLPGDEPQAAE